MVSSLFGNGHPRGRLSFDSLGSFVNVMSNSKKVTVTICLFAFALFMSRPKTHLAGQVTSHSSPESVVERMDLQRETGMPVGEANYAATVSESNASAEDSNTEPVPASGLDLETVKQTETSPVGDGITQGKPGSCLKHVLYDKPVKTGSTAISVAIREFLALRNEVDTPCDGGPLSCVERAKSVCNGTVAEQDYFSIIGHLRWGGRELAECLRPNYYVVTSVREPYQRRKSAYLWNRTLNATHFNIPYTASFKEFMNRMPRCQLHHYYDGRGWECDAGISLEDRIEDIVSRVDEVIDVYDEPAGPLHKLIARFLRRKNESIKLNEADYVEDFDHDTLKEEQMLYDRLRAKRLEPPNKDRLPC